MNKIVAQKPVSTGASAAFLAELAELDSLLKTLSQALIDDQFQVVEAQMAELPQGLRELSEKFLKLPPAMAHHPAMRPRMQQIGVQLQLLRLSLARRASAVERGLQVLFPAPSQATYGRAAGSYGGARAAGHFTSMHA